MGSTRAEAPLRADEFRTYVGFLNYHRDTLRQKSAGLSAEQLSAAHPPSNLTLGGLLKHAALNELHWFTYVLHGHPMPEPFASADWEKDVDWELASASEDRPQTLRELLDGAIRQADLGITEAFESGGLDHESARTSRDDEGNFSLRWIMLHMIEEYARHNGHADFIRESIDGETGE